MGWERGLADGTVALMRLCILRSEESQVGSRSGRTDATEGPRATVDYARPS